MAMGKVLEKNVIPVVERFLAFALQARERLRGGWPAGLGNPNQHSLSLRVGLHDGAAMCGAKVTLREPIGTNE